MINFKDPQMVGPSVVTVLSIVALAATLSVMLLVPKPTAAGMAKERREKELDIRIQRQQAMESREASQSRIDATTWNLPAEEIGPAALAKVNTQAVATRVKVLAFRPQRSTEVGDLVQHAFLVSLEGEFPAVCNFIKEMQSPQEKLAVNLVQITSADGASDRVTASVAVVAYQLPPKVTAVAPSNGGATNRG